VVDFAPLLATAQRLISENGRSVTFIRHDETLADPLQPWLGPADPRATPDASLALDAVFVEPSSAVKLGIASETDDLILNSEQIMIVAPTATDLKQFQEVIDETIYWKITEMTTLRPGTLAVVSFVGVKR
jgi:hypothetical protein